MTTRPEHLLKIGTSGIRGVVGEFLTPGLVASFAQAFGTYVGGGAVVVGRDSRRSGETFEHAVRCGLLAAGCEVIEVGIAPTPAIQIYVKESGAHGGIAVTASHNPPEYNALKLFNHEGLFLNNYERGELVDLYHQRDFLHAGNDAIRGVRRETEAPPRLHLERVLAQVDVERIRRRRFRVALDGVNGAGSHMSVRLLEEELGCRLEAIWVDPSQPFPREAEPRPDTLAELSRLVQRCGCEIGFGQDPDGDRLAVAGETGTVLDNDDVLALVEDTVLERWQGDVVVNLTTSLVVDDVARKHQRRVYRAPVGEANVVDRMRAVGAAIGGEGSSGGIIFPPVHLCRDSFSGMALLLDRLAEKEETVSNLAARLPRYWRRHGQVRFEHGRLGALMQTLDEAFPGAPADRTDGLKILLESGWIHVRASNTEPLLRLGAEARSQQEADDLYGRVSELARAGTT